MPVSVVSGTISTAVYASSVMLMLLIVLTPVTAEFESASQIAAERTAQAVAVQINSMRPGMTSFLHLETFPGVLMSVSFSDTSVTATVDGRSATEGLSWPVREHAVFSSGVYEITLVGGSIKFA